jgi:hypothetical protein
MLRKREILNIWVEIISPNERIARVYPSGSRLPAFVLASSKNGAQEVEKLERLRRRLQSLYKYIALLDSRFRRVSTDIHYLISLSHPSFQS